jgi:EmrB/QacA subfamily drug resistance transporter
MSTTTPPAEAGRLVALRSGRGVAVITATVLASMVGFLDAYVVNVAVPAIKLDLHASVASLQFVVAGYLLTVAALLLLSGSLADRFGLKRVLQVGLVIMFVASIGCSFTPNVGLLIVARIVQGIGAALVVPSSLAMLNGTLRMQDRARGIGIWAGLATLGSTVGPYVGGWLVDHESWRWIFLLNLPLIVIGLVVLIAVPGIRPALLGSGARKLSIDIPGAALAVFGLGGVIYALTTGPSAGWTSPAVLIAGIVGLACLIVFVPVERRRSAPMLRLTLFLSKQFSAINVATILLYGALGAANYLIVLQCELVLGYSATSAGAVLIPESIVFLAMAPLSGILVARFGPRWLMVIGMTIVGVAFAYLSVAHPGGSYLVAILPGVLLWGVGTGLQVTPLTASVLAAVRDSDLGEASAINDSAARVGAAVVVALVPLLIGATGTLGLGPALQHGFQPAMLVMAGLCVAAAIVSGIFVANQRATAPKMALNPRVNSCAPVVTDKPVAEVAK